MRKKADSKIINFLKREPILVIAAILAILSSFIVTPDSAYIGYIDFRTLGILFSLMAVMSGFKKLGCFKMIASVLLSKSKSLTQLFIILVFLCFFFSMIITNDVSLITFVPLTIAVLNLLGEESKRRFIIPVVVMQTIAANLGSMLTPIGNPQNLYLYGLSGLSLRSFILLMAPYTLLAMIMLFIWCLVKGALARTGLTEIRLSSDGISLDKKRLAIYIILFGICLLTVARILPYQALVLIILCSMLVTDKRTLFDVDYSLLLTFIAFFVFIGNMGRVQTIYSFLSDVITGHELLISVISSQIISNVPAALLLSGFTDNYTSLIVGTNLGGLGTLIASMASLISFKFVAKEDGVKKLNYIGYFMVFNVVFLFGLGGLAKLLVRIWS